MSDLYKNLKTLRKEKGISLEDINKRTKINISTLEAIESGDLSSLTSTYQRLFIRAYAAEIGANPEDVIKDLEKSMELKRKPVDQEKDAIEESILKPNPKLLIKLISQLRYKISQFLSLNFFKSSHKD